jgi:GntR family transcriptional regulator / MocR family aminotransferase
MAQIFSIDIDRRSRASLSEQIRQSIETAIVTGQLAAGARMPSWRDLSSQLGVARGTVKAAYERLIDAQLIVSAGPAGTHVTRHLPRQPDPSPLPLVEDPFALAGLAGPSNPPRLFQLGVPASEVLSAKTWSRMSLGGARQAAMQSLNYPDPRGEPVLRQQIAAYLAIARSVACREEQIFVTHGYGAALGLVVRALGLTGQKAWVENPGYPLSRKALELCGVDTVPIPVDAQGLDVSVATATAADAACAIVTPGQQAPLGMTMGLGRRHALLQWATAAGAYVIEDDYLGELQLDGRPAPSLASLDGEGRVIHVGTFSKTISPALRLGFVVVPPKLISQFVQVVALMTPASAIASQLAVATFIAEGHYLRHLRRARRLYADRRDLLKSWLTRSSTGTGAREPISCGLSLLLPLADGTPDVEIARHAKAFGMGPSPLSQWYTSAMSGRSGLLLGVTNVTPERLEVAGSEFWRLVDRYGEK